MSTRDQVKILTIAKTKSAGIKKGAALFLAAILLAVNSLLLNLLSFVSPAEAAASQRLKLVVFLVADQFPYNYFSQCADKFQANGFRQLLDNGANFTACRYIGATNQTASNLSVITTGAYPWSSGIVGNEWYDRRKQKTVAAIAEEENSPEKIKVI